MLTVFAKTSLYSLFIATDHCPSKNTSAGLHFACLELLPFYFFYSFLYLLWLPLKSYELFVRTELEKMANDFTCYSSVNSKRAQTRLVYSSFIDIKQINVIFCAIIYNQQLMYMYNISTNSLSTKD